MKRSSWDYLASFALLGLGGCTSIWGIDDLSYQTPAEHSGEAQSGGASAESGSGSGGLGHGAAGGGGRGGSSAGAGATQQPGVLIGMGGVFQEDYADVRALGVLAVGPRDIDVAILQAHFDAAESLDAAKNLGLGIWLTGPGRNTIQDGDLGFDFAKLADIIESLFGENELASDPFFVGYKLVDEPCDTEDWNITADDLVTAYQTVKDVDENVPIMINFSSLACLQQLADQAPGQKFVDIAQFIVNERKTDEDSNYVDKQHEFAQQIKEDFDILINPWLMVVAYKHEYFPNYDTLPSADWVETQGLALVEGEFFDGVTIAPYRQVSSWMEETIIDVMDDPAYVSAITEVYAAARAKLESQVADD